jgi:glutathione S-transferase
VNKYLHHLDRSLEGKDYLMGKQFTVADAYVFIVVGWCQWVDISRDQYKSLDAFMKRVAARPAVHKVLTIEGLLD